MALQHFAPQRMRALRDPRLLGGAFMVVLAVVAAAASIMLAGTKTGAALALLAVAGPIALYAAIVMPTIFPLCLYVVLVPFDNLIALSSFGTVTKLLAIVSGAALVLWILRTKRYVIPDRSLFWWLLFLLWTLTTMLWAIDPEFAAPHLATLSELFVLFAAVSFMPIDRRTLSAFLGAVILGGTIAGAYGAYLFHRGLDVSKDGRLFLSSDNTIIDPNHFSAAMILPFCLALSLVVSTKRWSVRVGCIIALAFITGGVMLAGSRGALLAVAAAFLYLCWRSRHRATLGLLGLGAFAVGLASYGNVLDRFNTAVSSGGAGRTSIWAIGISALKSHPIFGVGYSNFPFAYNRAFLSVAESHYTSWYRAPHDIFIQTSVELGLAGFVLLVYVAWRQARMLKGIAPNRSFYTLRTALEAAYVGFAVSSIFLDMLEYKYLWLLFMTTAVIRNAAISQGELSRERLFPALLPSGSYE